VGAVELPQVANPIDMGDKSMRKKLTIHPFTIFTILATLSPIVFGLITLEMAISISPMIIVFLVMKYSIYGSGLFYWKLFNWKAEKLRFHMKCFLGIACLMLFVSLLSALSGASGMQSFTAFFMLWFINGIVVFLAKLKAAEQAAAPTFLKDEAEPKQDAMDKE
jgi:hypothetical protein